MSSETHGNFISIPDPISGEFDLVSQWQDQEICFSNVHVMVTEIGGRPLNYGKTDCKANKIHNFFT